ncbi:MAG: hypothetical protein AAF204_02185 [Pseudomonadota bacterium]
MASVSDFSASELELLVSLPYKVGVFVSHADDEGGEGDDEREMAALEACIQAIAKLHEDKPLTSDIMRQTLSMKSEWPRWSAQSFQAPDHAAQAVALMRSHASEAEQKNYKAALMEIASSVAQAYGEFGEFEGDDDGGLLGGLVSKITSGLSKLSADDANHPMNVSAAEDQALEQLREALRS